MDFLDFSIVGDGQNWGRRIFYGFQNIDVEISTGPNTSYLFQEKNADDNSTLFLV